MAADERRLSGSERIGRRANPAGRPRSPLHQEICQFHKVSLESDFERPIAVNRNRNADRGARLGVDVMAAVDALQRPAVRFQHSVEFLAGNGLQRASSIT